MTVSRLEQGQYRVSLRHPCWKAREHLQASGVISEDPGAGVKGLSLESSGAI